MTREVPHQPIEPADQTLLTDFCGLKVTTIMRVARTSGLMDNPDIPGNISRFTSKIRTLNSDVTQGHIGQMILLVQHITHDPTQPLPIELWGEVDPEQDFRLAFLRKPIRERF